MDLIWTWYALPHLIYEKELPAQRELAKKNLILLD